MNKFSIVSIGILVTSGIYGCSSSSGDSGGGGSGGAQLSTGGGPVAGADDTHCGTTTTTVDPMMCMGTGSGGSDGSGGDSGAGGNGGSAGDGAGGATGGTGGSGGTDCQNTDPGYGDIGYGAEEDDDDCKYHVTWSVTPVAVGQNETFTVSVTTKADGKPVVGAAPRAELFVPCELTHVPPGLDFNAKPTETSPGTYAIGPVQFDKSGRWAVRFHFFETCDDSPASPHGHAAFYLDVP